MMFRVSVFPSFRVFVSPCLLVFVAAVFVTAPHHCHAAVSGAQPAIKSVRVGFDGYYRVGFWTPVEVVLHGGEQDTGASLILSAPDGDGIQTEFAMEPFTLSAQVEKRVTAYVKFGRPDSTLAVVLHGEGVSFERRQFAAGEKNSDATFFTAYPSTQAMVLELGTSIGLEQAIGTQSGAADRTNVIRLSDAGHLPDDWIGYEGVDALVISPSAPGVEQAFSVGSSRFAALGEWLEQGGKLVLALGEDAPRLLGPDSPLGTFLPGRLGESTKLTRVTPLETFGGATLPRAAARRTSQDEVVAVRLSDIAGSIELAEGDFPLVVRAPRVFGEVAFTAVDLSRKPLAEWAGRRLFVKRLLAGRAAAAERGDEDETAAAPPTQLGLIDLSGQLRAALDQFRGVELAPFWLVAALAAVYIVLAGPADYFLLRAFGRRMALTWVTFPLLVLLACGGAFWASHWLKGDRLIINQVDLVDVDMKSGNVRGTTWFNLFSPQTITYNLSVAPRAANDDAREVLLSWQGLPGGALGGMEQTMAGPASVARGYQVSADRAELRDVPVPVWATKSFVARWHTTVSPALEARLRPGADEVAEGTLTSQLDCPLSDCLLIIGRWAWQLGELKPGQTVRIVPGDQRDLQALLKDFKLVKERGKSTFVEVSTPYDPSGFDVRSIMRQMMFYDANRGRRYTGLLNRYQHHIDLSDHLALGQAVLWGAAAEAASEIRDHGRRLSGPDDRHWTFYRYLLPLTENTFR